MLIYIASPFFNPEQVAAVERLESLVKSSGHDFYSPRKDGVLIDMSADEKRKSAKKIFSLNIHWISVCDAVIAIIDDRDAGVIWELGFAYATRRHRETIKRVGIIIQPWIVTYTTKDYGLNVMIKECVDSHCRSEDQLRDVLVNGNWQAYHDFDVSKLT
jgi:nucleoside 2-deoxyribosyltransferase